MKTKIKKPLIFVIPVGIAMIRKDYHTYFAVGVLMGIVTVPLGLLVGGLCAGFSASLVFCDTFPILALSLLIALGLWKAQRLCILIFNVFGRILIFVATAGFAIGIIQALTPLTVIRGIMELLDGFVKRGNTVIVIEHNLDVMKQADYIVDIGPDGGSAGGRVVFTGTPQEMADHADTITAKYLRRSL